MLHPYYYLPFFLSCFGWVTDHKALEAWASHGVKTSITDFLVIKTCDILSAC
jgi:hypothetical protein